MFAPIQRPSAPAYLPPPPPPPVAVPAPFAPAPAAWTPAAAWPYAFPPPQAQHDGLDMLVLLATTAVMTPVAALVGAGLGWAIAGPVGAAKGAMIGGAAPGVLIAALEAIVHPIRKQPYHWLNSAFPLAGASIAGVLGGLGWLVAGPTGALVAVGSVATLAFVATVANGGLDAVGAFFGYLGSYFR